jgi:hypothetical protein
LATTPAYNNSVTVPSAADSHAARQDLRNLIRKPGKTNQDGVAVKKPFGFDHPTPRERPAVTRHGQSVALRSSRNGSVAAVGWSALFRRHARLLEG